MKKQYNKITAMRMSLTTGLRSYIKSISEKFKNFLKSPNITLAFYSLNKLDCIIRGHKDPLSNHSKKNIVYEISYKDCDATYVG